ncbi:hypothetical protein JL108_07330 [Aeromicrobium sp. YIM 150415]|nr:hypothetical protein [Aeromicrobium sp. YIM 150415]
MTQSQLSKRVRGAIPFTLDEVATIAALFEVPVGQLFGEGGPGYRTGLRRSALGRETARRRVWKARGVPVR